jgi:hypothetical protein
MDEDTAFQILNTYGTKQMRNGPARLIITGRHRRPVGQMSCVKADMVAMAWESIKAERPMLWMCEVASPVLSLMGQPHKLSMKVSGRPRPLVYFPDLELVTDRAFADQLLDGTPFWKAVSDWRPGSRSERPDAVRIYVEVKDDLDRRLKDPVYLHKLDQAREAYRRDGDRFAVVLRSRDIDAAPKPFWRAVQDIVLDHMTALAPMDIEAVVSAFDDDASEVEYGWLCDRLGGGPLAKAKLATMHVRRLIWVDISEGLTPRCAVRRILDGGARIRPQNLRAQRGQHAA